MAENVLFSDAGSHCVRGIPSTGRLRLSTCATCPNRPLAQPRELVCANELPGSAIGRLRQVAHVGRARRPRVRINSAHIWPTHPCDKYLSSIIFFGCCIQRSTLVVSCGRVGRCAPRSNRPLRHWPMKRHSLYT